MSFLLGLLAVVCGYAGLCFAIGGAAYKRGRSAFSFIMLALLLTPLLSYLILLIAGSDRQSEDLRAGRLVRCPSCAELVQAAARVCRFCSREIGASAPPAAHANPPAIAAVVLFTLAALGIAGAVLQSDREKTRRIEAQPASPPSPAPKSKTEAQFEIALKATEPCWYRVRRDGLAPISGVVERGRTQTFAARKKMVIEAARNDCWRIEMNGQPWTGQLRATGGDPPYRVVFELQR